MKKRNIVFALLTMTMLGGCGQQAVSDSASKSLPALSSEAESSTDTETLTPPKSDAAGSPEEAMSNLALELLAQTVKESGEQENILISPTSIELAMGMVQNGANGDTLDQMEDVLNHGLSIDDMNSAFKDISDRLESSGDVNWNIANSVWYKGDGSSTPKSDFIQKTNDWYDAEVFPAPFDDSTVMAINGWVSKETSGMIPQIISDISPNDRMCLINAIAFEGEWEFSYSDDQIRENQIFTNADGSESSVTTLYSEENDYFELENGIGFLRPYAGGQYSFFAILPDEGVSTADYIEGLINSDADLADALKNTTSGNVLVTIPEFSTDYATEMNKTFIDMGMDIPFDGERADFSNMADCPLFISQVIHSTHMELNREGTRAAAATAVMMTCLGDAPRQTYKIIDLDRPFVYGIVDNETGLPIFIGCMNNM